MPLLEFLETREAVLNPENLVFEKRLSHVSSCHRLTGVNCCNLIICHCFVTAQTRDALGVFATTFLLEKQILSVVEQAIFNRRPFVFNGSPGNL